MPDIFAVFEGGGVKGIGHVGALAQVRWSEPTLTIRGYAGASAGAIVAALAAAGYEAAGSTPVTPPPADSMQSILDGMDFEELLDGVDRVPLSTIQTFPSTIGRILREIATRSRRIVTSGLLTGMRVARWNALGWHIGRVRSENADLVSAFEELWEHKGVYGTRKFRDWIDGLLKAKAHLRDPHGNVTFASLKKGTNGTILKVIATDIAGRSPKIYDPVLTPSDHVADAIVASMTIPLFFRPFPFGPNNYYVDGGLLSNFPAWLFDEENGQLKQTGAPPLPVLGIRLVAPRLPTNITTTREYLSSLVATKLDGGDFLQTRLIDRYAGINVELPPGLNAWDFNLTDETKKSLFERGTFAAEASLLVPHNRSALGLP